MQTTHGVASVGVCCGGRIPPSLFPGGRQCFFASVNLGEETELSPCLSHFLASLPAETVCRVRPSVDVQLPRRRAAQPLTVAGSCGLQAGSVSGRQDGLASHTAYERCRRYFDLSLFLETFFFSTGKQKQGNRGVTS